MQINRGEKILTQRFLNKISNDLSSMSALDRTDLSSKLRICLQFLVKGFKSNESLDYTVGLLSQLLEVAEVKGCLGVFHHLLDTILNENNLTLEQQIEMKSRLIQILCSNHELNRAKLIAADCLEDINRLESVELHIVSMLRESEVEYRLGNVSSAKLRAQEALNSINQLTLGPAIIRHKISAFLLLGLIDLEENNYAEGLARFIAARQLNDSLRSEIVTIRCGINIGLAYYHLKEFDRAFDSHRNLLTHIDSAHPEYGRIQSNLTMLLIEVAQYAEAIKLADDALHALLDSDHNRIYRAELLYNLGYSAFQLGRYNDAIDALENALLQAQKLDQNRYKVMACTALGDIYKDLNQYQNGIFFYNEALNVGTKIPNIKSLLERVEVDRDLLLKKARGGANL